MHACIASRSNAYKKNNVSFTEQICSNPEIDMVYVIDGSGSIGRNNFNKIKDFIQDLNKRFTIGTNNVRVGIQEYSYSAIYPVHLGEADKNGNIDLLNDVVANMPYLMDGTYTGEALQRARTVVRECFVNQFLNFCPFCAMSRVYIRNLSSFGYKAHQNSSKGRGISGQTGQYTSVDYFFSKKQSVTLNVKPRLHGRFLLRCYTRFLLLSDEEE